MRENQEVKVKNELLKFLWARFDFKGEPAFAREKAITITNELFDYIISIIEPQKPQ